MIFISSESGSITLRHEKEGGGNYGHHASKAALNMVGKLLSLDLKNDEIIISIVHPGFMRTEMTKGVGFDKYWDDGGAVTPDEAAKSLRNWAGQLDMTKTGQYWAPRGPSKCLILTLDTANIYRRRYWYCGIRAGHKSLNTFTSAMVVCIIYCNLDKLQREQFCA